MNFFRLPRTVSSIVAAFANTVAELEQHAEEKLAARDEARTEAAKLHAEADEHDAEAVKAADIAARIRSLVG